MTGLYRLGHKSMNSSESDHMFGMGNPTYKIIHHHTFHPHALLPIQSTVAVSDHIP